LVGIVGTAASELGVELSESGLSRAGSGGRLDGRLTGGWETGP
jgi:hypothetical protein